MQQAPPESFSDEMQCRTRLLLGEDALSRLANARVLVFGVGGVGSWCIECLVRSGIRHITIVDSDKVSATNCNRQLIATSGTVGRSKVEVMKERLLEINPEVEVEARPERYAKETAASFYMEDYDLIVDAIDSLSDKSDLILQATALPDKVTFLSSMGAALKCDPFMVRKAEFWEVKGDPLARAIRKRFKKNGTLPKRRFMCVYSEEKPMENAESQESVEQEQCAGKAQINGSLCQVTAIFGFALAGMAINQITGKKI